MTIPTPPSQPTANPNRLLLLGAFGGAAAVLLLVVAVLIGYWLGRTSQPSTEDLAKPTTTSDRSTAPSVLPPVVMDGVPSASLDIDISSTPLPTDPALAAEEIDRHSDEQQRLATQKQTLNQQVTDSNQLIDLKAEQIRLLEAELAKQP